MSAQAPGKINKLSSSVTHVQGAIWECNCIVVKSGEAALVIDACWSRHDLDTVAESVSGKDTHLLVTHADIDHVCSAAILHEASVVAGPRSKERVASGAAGRDLVGEARKWGLALPGDLRVDQVVEAGTEVRLGQFTVATVEARGHAIDGLGYVLREEGLFAVGDYLMRSQYPMVWWSFSEARRTTERLLQALDEFDLDRVVPGHGPLLSVADARQIGTEDLAYMEQVEQVADEAERQQASPREWLLAVQSVEVPRPAAPDIEMLCPRLLNVAATFRDRHVDGELPWAINMA
jgi:glyoxylase-like metal-dependent hydrolase (beta-lactamase superfamily II)